MATTKTSAEIGAPVPVVYSMIADPHRLPNWDPSYEEATPLTRNTAGEPAFAARRTLANRGMELACRIVHADPPDHFAFVCDGGSGETIREDFALAPGRDGAGTRFTRELQFDLGAQDPLGVVPELTFTQAWLASTVEQSFAHLDALATIDAGARTEQGTSSSVGEAPVASHRPSGQ